MQSKQQLLASMEKLIKHIGRHRKNQSQIFNSLTRNDFRKILSNLSDTNKKLRIVSLSLLGELIYDDWSLKKQFCDMTMISSMPGKILLNPKLINPDLPYLREILVLLKKPLTPEQYRFNLWYIDVNNPKQVNFLDYYNPSSNLDPISNLIGIVMPKKIEDKTQNQVKISLAEVKNNNFYDHGSNRENSQKHNSIYSTKHHTEASKVTKVLNPNNYSIKGRNDTEGNFSPRLNYNLYQSHQGGRVVDQNKNYSQTMMQFYSQKLATSEAYKVGNRAVERQELNSKQKYPVLGGIKNQYEYIKGSEPYRNRKPITTPYHY